MNKIGRRNFIRNAASISTIALLAPSIVFSRNYESTQVEKWLAMIVRKVRQHLIKG